MRGFPGLVKVEPLSKLLLALLPDGGGGMAGYGEVGCRPAVGRRGGGARPATEERMVVWCRREQGNALQALCSCAPRGASYECRPPFQPVNYACEPRQPPSPATALGSLSPTPPPPPKHTPAPPTLVHTPAAAPSGRMPAAPARAGWLTALAACLWSCPAPPGSCLAGCPARSREPAGTWARGGQGRRGEARGGEGRGA